MVLCAFGVAGRKLVGMETSVPHSARIWNYWLGGKDNFPVDREVGDRLREVYPAIVDLARSDRDFLKRAVTWLAADAGIRQFLDIGSGLPTAANTHQVAQGVAPDSRVVYVDNDPMVIAQARGLLRSGPTAPQGTWKATSMARGRSSRQPRRRLTSAGRWRSCC
jgi:hypothetical protein